MSAGLPHRAEPSWLCFQGGCRRPEQCGSARNPRGGKLQALWRGRLMLPSPRSRAETAVGYWRRRPIQLRRGPSAGRGELYVLACDCQNGRGFGSLCAKKLYSHRAARTAGPPHAMIVHRRRLTKDIARVSCKVLPLRPTRRQAKRCRWRRRRHTGLSWNIRPPVEESRHWTAHIDAAALGLGRTPLLCVQRHWRDRAQSPRAAQSMAGAPKVLEDTRVGPRLGRRSQMATVLSCGASRRSIELRTPSSTTGIIISSYLPASLHRLLPSFHPAASGADMDAPLVSASRPLLQSTAFPRAEKREVSVSLYPWFCKQQAALATSQEAVIALRPRVAASSRRVISPRHLAARSGISGETAVAPLISSGLLVLANANANANASRVEA
ncbi:hypothetical protein PHYSODRAFT_334941 [Phytophthora sojae]|uniref:Uncharacterized protein n=1 Tax=Phytophthora sojae (strain P6497) TaxID=1094619 RepID=G4ZTI2_PHYSP|nr:hypothetical protein PHYSODRAFT_334941 [Phytophthora sojae]EGZ13160.1 hypothetical protein PHYSODRAFT_334941 [Phytophthora sojae]|eukprot:XP_009530589.1 hypothetical protein PHYSODRAFT_334941 [Phytophthora sojae]